MKQLPWLRKKGAALVELEAQLAAANGEYAAAREALDVAHADFDDSGDDKALKAVLAAKERVANADVHIGRAQRLVADREKLDEELRVEELRARYSRLDHELAATLQGETPLIEKEVQLLVELLRVREARWKVRHAAQRAFSRLQVVEQELHGGCHREPPSSVPVWVPVADLLSKGVVLRGQGDGLDPRAAMLDALKPNSETYLMYRGPIPPSAVKQWSDLEPIQFQGRPLDDVA